MLSNISFPWLATGIDLEQNPMKIIEANLNYLHAGQWRADRGQWMK